MPKIKRDGNKFVVEATYEEEREKYLKKIREVQDLGEEEEVERLQGEWKQKKQKLTSSCYVTQEEQLNFADKTPVSKDANGTFNEAIDKTEIENETRPKIIQRLLKNLF